MRQCLAGTLLRSYLWEQFWDNLQWCLVNRVILKRRCQRHVHQRPDLLQHHLPAAGVTEHLLVLVNLFLQEKWKGHTDTTRNPLKTLTGNGLPTCNCQVGCFVFWVLPFLFAQKLYLKHLYGKENLICLNQFLLWKQWKTVTPFFYFKISF